MTPEFKSPRWEAKFHGETLGWFDTAEEADAAVEAAIAQEESDNNA